MEGNVIDELFQRISELESEVETKNVKILELEKKLSDLTNPNPPPPAPRKPAMAHLKAFISQKLGFCSSVQGDQIKIEFPSTMARPVSDDVVLTRGLSTNSFIAQTIAEIDSISEQKKKINQTIESSKEQILKDAETAVQKIKDSFSTQMSSHDQKISKLIESISEELKGSLIIENSTQKLFLFEAINKDTMQVHLSQLKDSNGIALKNPKVVMDNLASFQKYRAVVKSETDSILAGLSTSTINIYYQLIEVENNEKVCCPVNITPEFLSLQEYEMKFNSSQSEISEVVNKSDGPVKFTTVVVSEDCGLVQTSMIEVFTCEVSSHILNIVHMHVEDMKDEVAIEAVYMLPDQEDSEYHDWTQDALGRNLRYKVLVKNGQVNSILYNTGSTTEKIHFLERRLQLNQYLSYSNSIIQIQSIPTGLLTRDWLGAKSPCDQIYPKKPPQGQCFSRYIEDLPGFIDVKVVMENGEMCVGCKEFSVPACLISSLSEKELSELERLVQRGYEEKVKGVEKVLGKIEEMIDGYNRGVVKSSKDFLEDLSENVRIGKEGLAEHLELVEKYAGLVQRAERIVRNVALDLRFSGN